MDDQQGVVSGVLVVNDEMIVGAYSGTIVMISKEKSFHPSPAHLCTLFAVIFLGVLNILSANSRFQSPLWILWYFFAFFDTCYAYLGFVCLR